MTSSESGREQDPDKNGNGQGQRRRRKRKVRKRIRIKKKSKPTRKILKVVERFIWVAVIAAFIATLVILVKQLDIREEKKKKKKKKKSAIPAAVTDGQTLVQGSSAAWPGAFQDGLQIGILQQDC